VPPPPLPPSLSRGAPGWATAVFGPEGLREHRTEGFASLSPKRPVSLDSVFRWFSITKIATAEAILLLEERGRLDLDDAVGAHVPWAVPEPALPPLRIRDLLSHRSGLADPVAIGWAHPPGAPRRGATALARAEFAAYRRLGKRRAAYSNLNYLLLGAVVEGVAGVPFDRFVEDAVLEPLAVAARFAPPEDTPGHERSPSLRSLVMGWLFDPKAFVAYRHRGWLGLQPFVLDGDAYGGLSGSLEDLVALGRHHLGDAPRVLRQRAGDGFGAFAYGWWRFGDWYLHGGSSGGFRSELWLQPKRRVGVAVLANAGDAPAWEVAVHLARRHGIVPPP
jgi:CubicO group peptidase (beta-lactamase class C family)